VSIHGGAAVEAVVEAGGAGAGRVMLRVEERMVELVSTHGELLARHGGETITAGGKRLRPLLVCIAAGVPVEESEALVRAAVAVELVHAATLVHDDVIDGADLRRGKPTVVASGGRLLALATGDLLFSRAFAELARGSEIEPIRVLSAAASALASGELMQREDAWNAEIGQERYLERCRLKTGVLFRAACELGAFAGGAPLDALGRFGESIGIAFQLLDDVLDVTGPAERTGKPRGTDLLDGTLTLPLIEARKRDPELAGIELRAVETADQAAAVCDRIEASGALDFARDHALAVVADAKASLPRRLPEAQRSALELVADGVVERYS
jgi:geranylgeranyl pyrophosphate synthase